MERTMPETSGSGIPAREHAPPPKPRQLHPYPIWSPRFWHGMRFGDWMRLLAENRFRVDPSRWAMAGLISLITPFNTVMSRVQRWKYGRRIAETQLAAPPLFIIGHWRSGTTFLHELLVHDARFTYPTTYQCFAPYHFLLTEWFLARYCGFLLPKRRPMDNMLAGWYRPQEDEFALLTMGQRTPYRRMAFPNNPAVDLEYLNMEGVSGEQLRRWSESLQLFVRSLSYRDPRRVVLKSPPHTGRVAVLARIFPGAQFIHITRHPYALFASTRRLWQSLDAVQGCQRNRDEQLDEYVYAALDRMYDGFEAQRGTLAPGQIVDVRYEDLVADPLGMLEQVYEQLELGAFEPVRARFAAHLTTQKGYQTNRHEIEPSLRREIRRRWARYFEHYGYDEED
jgi:hypothetical protein